MQSRRTPQVPLLAFVVLLIRSSAFIPSLPRLSKDVYAISSAPAATHASTLEGTDRSGLGPGLLEWYSRNGVNKKDCKVTIGPSSVIGGLGLIAASSIKAKEVVAIVPLSLCLSADSVRASPIGKALQDFVPGAGEASLIALQLLYEASLGSKSKYATFLQALPRPGQDGFDHPLFWSDDELAVLSKSSTRDVAQLIENVVADYKLVKANVLEAGNGAGLGPDALSLDEFKWAVAVTLSRAFYGDNALRLAPLVDMVNKGTKGGYEPDVVGLGIFGGKGFRVVADKDYKPGEEVLVSYGPKTAVEFLEDHGFVPDDVTTGEGRSICELTFEIKEEQDNYFYDKEDILNSEKLPLRRSFDLSAAGDADPNMVQFLRLFNLSGKDAFLLEAVFRRDVWRFLEMPLSEDNERSVDECIIKACSDALRTFEEAEVLSQKLAAEGKAKPERLQLCARIRGGEKPALKATQAWAERDLTALDIKEYYQERRLNELGLSGPLRDDEMRDSAALSRQGRSARDIDW